MHPFLFHFEHTYWFGHNNGHIISAHGAAESLVFDDLFIELRTY